MAQIDWLPSGVIELNEAYGSIIVNVHRVKYIKEGKYPMLLEPNTMY